MLLTIDAASSVPLFEQLAAGIRSHIVTGTVSAGQRLPAARELAESLDVNVHTVLHAYQLLRDEGFVDLRRGRGAVVTSRAHDYVQLMRDIDRVVQEARRLELTPGALGALIREAYQ
ncbi:GntR family transcriptional regulator [Leifsonia sp. H3M29-4]|uniref:GntR family transcriptional regulator n=1 Tax=Salinibacterium metalliresistens TaxID=3031321 RepID=UPI0023DB2A41|nr:GntR family transcriptional regulator [Salinibacterium metalliresistens]MDF1478740.1 GntR family transcriptional regulator [Salinibacterium metalliresistens]